MSRRRRAARSRQGSGQWAATLRLTAVLLVLVGINVYVFFFSSGSLKQVSQAAQAASTHEAAPVPAVAPTAVAAPVAHGSRKDGIVREHEGLGGVLRREGLVATDVDAVLRALQPIMAFKRELHAGQKYTVRTGADGRLEGFELRAAPGIVYTVAREDGKWTGKKSAPTQGSRGAASARGTSGTP